jgi:hypothetical protein
MHMHMHMHIVQLTSCRFEERCYLFCSKFENSCERRFLWNTESANVSTFNSPVSTQGQY